MLRSEEKSINDDYEQVTKAFSKLFTQLQFQSKLILFFFPTQIQENRQKIFRWLFLYTASRSSGILVMRTMDQLLLATGKLLW